MVTLVGWVAILVGLFRMFAPEVRQASQNAPTTIISASLVGAIGLFLTFKAGSRQDGEDSSRTAGGRDYQLLRPTWQRTARIHGGTPRGPGRVSCSPAPRR